MIIGHLPAAYILSSHLHGRLMPQEKLSVWLVVAGMLGGIFPDFDMFYFHLVDHRQHHHHSYWSHYPLLWLLLLAGALLWWRLRRGAGASAYALLFTLNGFIHLCLDTPLGRIRWMAPFRDTAITLYSPAARYEPWWLNFLLNPTFLLELLLLSWAIALFVRRLGSRRCFRYTKDTLA